MSLEKYHKKRNFADTPEPKGAKKSSSGTLKFVIHKHWATQLHYDFRIELEGTMKSWAVPKGPPLKPGEKHLAMMVEDHPMDYRNFEGVIPEGNYGAGTVMIWDEGTYHALDSSDPKESQKISARQLSEGSIKLILKGKKLKGEFALVRFKRAGENAWLMLRHDDEWAREPIQDLELSARSGRSQEQISKGKSGTTSNSDSKKPDAHDVFAGVDFSLAQKKALTSHVKPMLAKISEKPFDNSDWLFEIKWDGYRALADISTKGVRLYSRNNIDFNSDYPEIVSDLERINDRMLLDGEIVVIDDRGKADFQSLQNYSKSRSGKLMYYVFDLLYFDKYDLSNLPLLSRKQILKHILPKLPHMRLSEYVLEQGKNFYKVAKQQKLEGIMAKKIDSIYKYGERTDNWLKIKIEREQEAIIGGYTHPQGNRNHFGSLLLGEYKRGKLHYIGNTGSGFSEEILKDLKQRLDQLQTSNSPFVNEVELNNVATWVEPRLVCEVKYANKTEKGFLRQAIYLGLRKDKKPQEVTLEQFVKVKSSTPKYDFEIETSNLDKIYWPRDNYTKGDSLAYYDDIAPYILPYLKDRPQNMNRHPHGIDGESFYHKDFEQKHPRFVKTVDLVSKSNAKTISYLVCQNKETLLYMANLGCIEINPWNSRIGTIKNPDYLVFDLDPNEIDFGAVVEVALLLQELLDELKVQSYCKSSGIKGLHIYVPLAAQYNFEQARLFTELIGTHLLQRAPKLVSLERDPDQRKQKVYIDYLQNRKGQTTVAPYSLRPIDGAQVSAPLKWEEVNKKLKLADYNIQTMPERLKKVGDLWKGVLGKGVDMTKALKKIESMHSR